MLQRLDGLDVDRLTDIDNYATSSGIQRRRTRRHRLRRGDDREPLPVTMTSRWPTCWARFGEAGVIEADLPDRRGKHASG